ncbi:type I restriction-modification enzyme R subunit C-terminal domain-containing protein [Micromonospora sp. DT4]|uniref:type I restriction-modification enzyme R subunit C-terminal domain-containing protein n=1 Tax=Micromonospora sp. DT4 TaxID=3393438 RepID=UPI003CE7C1B9
MLGESGVGDKQDIDQARRASEGLGLFIRTLTGLDRAAAQEAFSEFLIDRTLNGAQLDFINLIINDLTMNGVMEPGRLYESPFNGVAPRGPEVLFSNDDADRMVSILRSIKYKPSRRARWRSDRVAALVAAACPTFGAARQGVRVLRQPVR